MVKFISYDGHYPTLCLGTLTLEIDSELSSAKGCLCSGGSVSFTADWDEIVTRGDWTINWSVCPKHWLQHKDIICTLVNENVPYGCCGGCV